MIELLAGLTLGLHLGTIHVPRADDQRGINPGVYVQNADGVTAGLYLNTLSKPSLYLGQTWHLTRAPLPIDVTLSGVTGYQRQWVGATCVSDARIGCGKWSTASKLYINPMLAISTSLQLEQGTRLRLAIVPPLTKTGESKRPKGEQSKLTSSATAIHFSIENDF